MIRNTFLIAVALAVLTASRAVLGDEGPSTQWRSLGPRSSAEASEGSDTPRTARNTPSIDFPSGASSPRRVSADEPAGVRLAGANLPADGGQVWREYDISTYAMRVSSTERPEQAIVDWILRETGYEAWHGETVSILSASPRKLRVYHTPEIQAVVAEIVDRFVGNQSDSQAFGLRIVSVNNPNWRAKAQGILQPVKVQSQGVQAWVLRKEDAAFLLADLRRRSDYREHSSPYLMVYNGQSSLVNLMRPTQYIRDIIVPAGSLGGYQPEAGQIDEGLSLEFSPLLSLDTQLIDATIKCTATQVDKMIPVVIEVPASPTTRQRTKVDVPQMTHFRFHERFRWPTDHVLLISLGMVAAPTDTGTGPLAAGLPMALGGHSGRADLLVMVESKPQQERAASGEQPPLREAKTYRGRY
ncbi:MAG TPA: hypothetical protein DD670_04195 [Planctomycetaceae bacterium]|nr:hypothetical protein [Planctomycetaceae bacterium]